MPVFSYETYLTVNATQRLIELTQREKQLYKNDAYRRCGHGLTIAQFDVIVAALAEDSDPWLKINKGPLGAVVLTYVE